MSTPYSARPMRVAVIGAGPTGFYAADHLLRQTDFQVEVDLYDRLPTPFGLVRGGVAPDHFKIKSVTRVFDKVAANPGFRFFGNVEFGRDVTIEDLQRYYDAVFFSTGAQTDRSMGIPGENLKGSHSATEFVAWYNGHPDYRDLEFDLSQERVAVVGVGNVAIDVARILCRPCEELEKTDIAPHALEALRKSKVKEVVMMGRRGPVQAAFTTPEVKELAELGNTDVIALPEEVELDDFSRAYLEREGDKNLQKKVELIQEYANNTVTGREKRLYLRFLVSPTELIGNGNGHVAGMKIVHNELYTAEDGSQRSRATDRVEALTVGLVFRSVGYMGVALPGVPFDARKGVIPNAAGRILDNETREQIPGLYTAGWIKRGPSGVIGTNKPDAVETVDSLMQDARDGRLGSPSEPTAEAAAAFVRSRAQVCDWQDWTTLDRHETTEGSVYGRPRLKLTSVREMLSVLGR